MPHLLDASTPATLPASTQRRLIGAKQLSPVELLDDCIARITTFEPAVNALCATDFDRARAAARAAEAAVMRGEPLGALHGLPVGIKDLEDTAGLRTTYGNIAFRNHVPTADCLLVQRLKAAGAIVLAKTNTPDSGAGANTRNAVWGATGNPFDPTLNAGGSSGGSAAALALDYLPLATGSDLGGSLRTPAALCGIVGFRPSLGVVPSERRALGFGTLWATGPMARSVGDLELMLRAISGFDARDPWSGARFEPLPLPDLSRLSIGFSEDFGACAVDDDIRRVFRHRLAAIAPRVGRLEAVDFPYGDADRAFDVLRAEGFLADQLPAWRERPESLSPNVRANLELAAGFTLADRAAAGAEQARLQRALAALLERHDLIVAPVTPLSPFPWTQWFADTVQGRPQRNYYHWLALTYVITLTSHPALALPCGRDERGLPFGLQLIGRLHGDAPLLAAARAFEAAFAADPVLARPRPDLAALRTPRPELKSIVTDPPT
ncbi:amidase [Aquincola sp. S2]|uniref:Amidase n=1 Tax=Pseudaquabacterium terrae TaxID=2732868 RepID=A0ABX2EET6_9BURK|nr:amidase family protein [Aquabacterium terrae]NRF67126.1 amidase [Aquabacterium terrae]